MDDASIATRKALNIDGIKDATFWSNASRGLTGTMWDDVTGQEYDVHRDGSRWRVNDDEGIDHTSLSLSRAVSKARKHASF